MKNILKRDDKGTINLGGKVIVSDPQYGLNCQCQGILKNVLSGEHKCFVEFVDEGEVWGVRVSAIEVTHADYIDNANKFTRYLEDFIVGVDGGAAGIFDYKYFAYYHNEHNSDERVDEKWAGRCYEKTFKYIYNSKHIFHRMHISIPWGDTIDNSGLVSRSGFGDGGYECYTRRNYEGKIISIRVEFIKTNAIEHEEPKITKAVKFAVEFWCNEVRKHNKDITDDQMSLFARELSANLGKARKICDQTLDGGEIGHDFEDAQVVPNALKAANIDINFTDKISVYIHPWYGNPKKRTIWMYQNGGNGVNLADVEEED